MNADGTMTRGRNFYTTPLGSLPSRAQGARARGFDSGQVLIISVTSINPDFSPGSCLRRSVACRGAHSATGTEFSGPWDV